MGKVITNAGGIRYSGALTVVNSGGAQANLIHSYTGSGVLRFVRCGSTTISIEIDGVHKIQLNATSESRGLNIEFTTGFKIYSSTAIGSQVSWVYQIGSNKYNQVVGGSGPASAGSKALQTSVSGSGRIALATIEPAGGKLDVDGVTLFDNQTSVLIYVADIYYQSSFNFYGVGQLIAYT